MATTALIIAAVLIAAGAGLELRSEIAVARRTRAGALEWVWIVLPVVFLVVLVVLSGRSGVW